MSKSKSAGDEPSSDVLAMVLAREARLPDPELLKRELQKAHDVKLDLVDDSLATFEVDGEPSTIGLVPALIPWSQLEGPCATAWWWPEATAVCKPCPAHFVVTTRSSRDDVFEANLRLTSIVAALLRVSQAPAVYWGAGTVVRSAEDFCEQAEIATREFMPLWLWIDFRVAPDGDANLFFATTGMSAFGLMEIESVAPRSLVDHVLDRMFNVAHYACDHGAVLKDGDTFGLLVDERIRISHRPSRWKRPGKVLFLEW